MEEVKSQGWIEKVYKKPGYNENDL
jgi:hypothetical protein